MANLSASKKDIRTSARRRDRNFGVRKDIRTVSKELLKKIKSGDKAGALTLLPKAFSVFDKAVKKNILHKNNVARKKSAMSKAVAALK
jgi:small subunit ribosomal protein S20